MHRKKLPHAEAVSWTERALDFARQLLQDVVKDKQIRDGH